MDELWEEIEEFPGYEVSDLGRVRNKRTRRMLRISDNGSKALVINLQRYGRSHVQQVRWLVADIFLDPPFDPDSVPQHLDRDYTNCQAANLHWMSRSDIHWRLYQESVGMDPDHRPIEIVNTKQEFVNIFQCAEYIQGYAKEIHRTMYNPLYTYKDLKFAYLDGGPEFHV